jgi:ketosteroid isomerase-like protein
MTSAVLPGARDPQDSTLAFTDSISRGNLDAATNCFTKDACLLTPDATTIRGREEIRPILHQLIVIGARIEVQESSIVRAGEVALASERWAFASGDAEGAPFARTLSPTLVMRRVEGVWKLAVAMPWARS